MAKKENQPQTLFGGDLAILNGLGGSKDEGKAYATFIMGSIIPDLEGESSEVQQFANLGNCSPPMHQSRGASSSSPPPSSEFPKREPKPGAKQVRWSDHTGHRPLEQVREIEIFFGERGLSSWVGLVADLIFSLFVFTDYIPHHLRTRIPLESPQAKLDALCIFARQQILPTNQQRLFLNKLYKRNDDWFADIIA